MRRKWSELMHRHNEQDEVSGNGNNDGKGMDENCPPRSGEAKASAASGVREELASFPATLIRVEDIYRSAGIISPRSGYGIGKVIEMLHSEHTRELSKEAR